MPLSQGQLRHAGNSGATFTMCNGDVVVECSISQPALDAISQRKPMETADQQFERLFDDIAELASRKFFRFNDNDRPQHIAIERADVQGR